MAMMEEEKEKKKNELMKERGKRSCKMKDFFISSHIKYVIFQNFLSLA